MSEMERFARRLLAREAPDSDRERRRWDLLVELREFADLSEELVAASIERGTLTGDDLEFMRSLPVQNHLHRLADTVPAGR